jgi:alcohol dehydrogenase
VAADAVPRADRPRLLARVKRVDGFLASPRTIDPTQGDTNMKALVYHGPGKPSWEEIADPELVDAGDAIVEVETTTICGTDLHILKGDVPAVIDGRVLGHEGVGTVVAIGAAVRNVAVGDRVIISCICACGVCTYCRSGNPSHCMADEGASGIGWILGHLIDGTQAEYVRVPFADNALYKVPPACRTTRRCCSQTSSRPASRSESSTDR